MSEGGAILVVEDDADVRRSARLALGALASRVDTLESAPDSQQAGACC